MTMNDWQIAHAFIDIRERLWKLQEAVRQFGYEEAADALRATYDEIQTIENTVEEFFKPEPSPADTERIQAFLGEKMRPIPQGDPEPSRDGGPSVMESAVRTSGVSRGILMVLREFLGSGKAGA